MNPENFYEAKWRKNYAPMQYESRCAYLKRHSEFWELDFPKTYYFKIYDDRCAIHWAVIRDTKHNYFAKEPYIVYFIDVTGQAFDKLEFKTKKQAQRALRKNKFFFSTNKKCPYEPVTPIYINLHSGKKSAPYSKGNLWTEKDREKSIPAPKISSSINRNNSFMDNMPDIDFIDVVLWIVFLLILISPLLT